MIRGLRLAALALVLAAVWPAAELSVRAQLQYLGLDEVARRDG